MAKITAVRSREILDSRGRPTVEVDIHCDTGAWGRASVPSGASTSQFEAHPLVDDDPFRFFGRGVLQAVQNVTDTIGPEIMGRDPFEQEQLDELMLKLDGTPNKKRLGANAILGVSLALAHTAAAVAGVPLFRHIRFLAAQAGKTAQADSRTVAVMIQRPAAPDLSTPDALPRLPLPMINMLSGGRHAGGRMDFQDFLIMPVGAKSLRQALQWATEIYGQLGRLLELAGHTSALVGDEGGFGPDLASPRQALTLLVQSIEAAKLKPREDVAIAIDVASTQFYRQGMYYMKGEDAGERTSAGMVDYLEALVKEFPIVSIEDGLAEDDWNGWKLLSKRLGRQVWLVGDDLFSTNPERVTRGLQMGIANSVLIKPNQIGTLTETLRTLASARLADYGLVVSARSGETEDTTLADLAVGTGAGQIKIGSIVRGERLCKYNRLLRIEEELRDLG